MNARRNLLVTASTLDPTINVNGQGRIRFEIENNSAISDRNVNVSILIPPSLVLANVLDDAGNEVEVIGKSPDSTRYDLEPRREMRPGDKVIFDAIVIGVRPGSVSVEAQAFSENTAGMISAKDSISINP